ncbi:MAG: hypothetical protein K5864_00030 [Bacteroidales bacterium]|nr:hypothetical protein [Bacteroidales bacterium]
MFFTEDFTLSTLICDEDDRLTIWGMARLFQDVAGDHSDSLGVGFNGLKPVHKAWVLTRVYYKVMRFPTAGEHLTLRTWPRIDNGLIAPRDYQLIDADGNICATSSSQWVIIDMLTRRVCRLHELIEPFEREDVCATDKQTLEKIVMPADMPLLKRVEVPYSAIDHTRHTNNAEYMKWISDSIPDICKHRDGQRKEIDTFDIAYLKETQYADPNVAIHSKQDGDTHYFQVLNSNGVAVNAIVRLH